VGTEAVATVHRLLNDRLALGVPNAPAMSTAIAFRMATYYLPPVWGAIAMRWLRQHAYR
jgi:hypothetical protein